MYYACAAHWLKGGHPASFLAWGLPQPMQSMALLLDLGLPSFQTSLSVNKYGFALSAVHFSAIWASRPAEQAALTKRNGFFGAYVSTLFLTITNPMTILSFAAIFAGIWVVSTGVNYISAGMLVFGVFLGSTLWWLILSFGIGLFRTKFNPDRLLWVNKISGITILGFGLIALLGL